MAQTTDESNERTGDDEAGDDSPSLRQKLHAATGDRDAEAKALADRSPDDVTEHDAAVAVNRARGESIERVPTDSELASPDDAQRAADEEEDDQA